ncbi:MAG TPA: molybdopterin molybdenumtransferase MoeA [Leucothrix mucor]|uniref:Molybdopterin molybdenumtransferase n=1 Tax=Leucothrix mucor TaxID=45248 RepID=A0A7V2T2Z6_LEUMU|nr:molybdopterin molybdenumtransferase MoeA [Leucothrix mucor]
MACGCDDNCDTKQTLMPVDQAMELLLANAIPSNKTETVNLMDAGGRILAEDLCSSINVPPADNSAMDGYAVRSTDFNGDEKISLPISQRICAGAVGTELEANTVARIFTGASIPAGADAVIMQEICELEGDNVIISGPIAAGTNLRKTGEDIAVGDTILKVGNKLKPQDLGLAASVGISQLKVYRRLRVGIFFTGDELREPDQILHPGQIYNSNRYTLCGLLQNLGCDIIDLGIVEDTLEATRNAMQKAAEQSDLVMTSGGVSVGEEDYVRIALEELGQLELWRINIKPGKPLAFGKIGDTPFLGMPGNPVSVFATFCIFAHPYIQKKSGATDVMPNSFMVSAGFEWKKKGYRCEYVRARIEKDASGNSSITLFPHQGSGVLTSTSWANGLAVIPPDRVVNKGELVEFIPYSEMTI